MESVEDAVDTSELLLDGDASFLGAAVVAAKAEEEEEEEGDVDDDCAGGADAGSALA